MIIEISTRRIVDGAEVRAGASPVVLPADLGDADLAAYGFAHVTAEPQPSADAVPGEVYEQDGGYHHGWITAEPEQPDWPTVIAARRYQAEVAGIDVGGMHVDTDDRSKLLINGAAVEAMLDPEYLMRWKTPGGFVELTAAEVIAVARAVRAHVQACFNREAELLAELTAETFTPEMLEQGWPAS